MSKLDKYKEKLLIEWKSKSKEDYDQTLFDFIIEKSFEELQKGEAIERCFKPKEEGSMLL